MATGTCSFGDACRYSHVSPAEQQKVLALGLQYLYDLADADEDQYDFERTAYDARESTEAQDDHAGGGGSG
jgi:hypothetical protein